MNALLVGGVLFFLWPKGGENLAGSAVGGWRAISYHDYTQKSVI
jgi:hypothetical protein